MIDELIRGKKLRKQLGGKIIRQIEFRIVRDIRKIIETEEDY